MALEDFVRQAEESQVDLRPVQHRIDFSDPENEDLFGFEDLTVLPAGAAPAPPGAAQLAESTPASGRVDSPAAAPTEAAGASGGDDDDEDLLEFDELDEAPASVERAPAPEPTPEPVAAVSAAKSGVQPAGEDLLDDIAPAPETSEPEAVASDERADEADTDGVPAMEERSEPLASEPAPKPRSARERHSARRVVYTEDELPTLVLPGKGDLPRPGVSLPAALIGCFLALNLALVIFAWRTSNSFENTMATITEAVSNTALEARTIAELSEPTPSGGPSAPSTSGGFDLDPQLVPSAVENFHPLSLKIARQHLDGGSFAEARLTLNHMLANKARADVSTALQAEAEFMIAESYHKQAQAIRAVRAADGEGGR